MLFILYRIGKFIALHTPLKFGYSFAGFIASACCLFSKNDREAVKENLRVLFPDYSKKKIGAITRKIFINFGKYLVDFFRFSKIDKDYMDKYIKVEGIENMRDALKDKKGVIALSAHLGNWELGGVAVSLLGFPFAAVVLKHADERINRFFIEQREMKGVDVITVGTAVRRCFSALANNSVVALVGDRDYFDNGIEMDFLGKPMLMPKGPAVFNRRCGSPIVPTFMIRNHDDTFTLKFCEPIRPQHTKDEHHNLIETTKKVARVMEKAIRAHPCQWYVFKRFWERIGWERKSL